LTASQRDVLLWRAQGYSYQAIGHGLGISSGTARDRAARAEQKIELHLAKGSGRARNG
jgi:DNA-directed RNA polymerase specialized sigma24 family protein